MFEKFKPICNMNDSNFMNVAATPAYSMAPNANQVATILDSIEIRRPGELTVGRTEIERFEGETVVNKENVAPVSFSRDRNPRRDATKKYSELSKMQFAELGCLDRSDSPQVQIKSSTMPKRKRASMSDNRMPPEKRRRLSYQSSMTSTPHRRRSLDSTSPDETIQALRQHAIRSLVLDPVKNSLRRPVHDVNGDAAYVVEMRAILRGQSTAKSSDVGKRQAKRILGLLKIARPPTEAEALFLTEAEAATLVTPNNFWNNIIVTEGQQLLPLQTIEQFFDEYYNDEAKVWIQDPSSRLSRDQPSVRQVTISQVKKRFAGDSPISKPWNLLELATHYDDGLRPPFLNNEDCRLLTKLKIPGSTSEARRRSYLPGYKEVEKWALLAQAGALTEPHQDSHGYSTFITVNVGRIGFGWLSFPTDEDRAAWIASPHTYTGTKWRFIVLRPGQTVYFPAGTVHFVFRLPSAGDSLAFGGHVLRCSTLVQWAKTLLEEKRNPAITNEDFTESVPGYLNRVETFVKQALKSGDERACHKWGGREAIEEFLRLQKQFLGS